MDEILPGVGIFVGWGDIGDALARTASGGADGATSAARALHDPHPPVGSSFHGLATPDAGSFYDPEARVVVRNRVRVGASRTDRTLFFCDPRVVVAVGAGSTVRVDGAAGRPAAEAIADLYLRARGAGRAQSGPFAGLGGRFCFVLWDRRERRLFAATDSTGVRPLAYWFDGRTLLIATRTTALFDHPDVPRRWDPLYFAHALDDVWHQPAGTTPFAGIHRVRPGFMLELCDGALVERSIGDRPPSVRAGRKGPEGIDRDIARFWSALTRSIQQSLAGGARACLALSGGMDSCAVGAAFAEVVPTFRALSIVGPEHAPETVGARAFVRRYPGVSHREMDARTLAVESWSECPVPLTDDPIAVGPAFQGARRALAAAARGEGFEMVLDGEGGDELFAMCLRRGDWMTLPWAERARFLFGRGTGLVALLRRVLIRGLPQGFVRARRRRRLAVRTIGPPWVTNAHRTSAERRSVMEAWLSFRAIDTSREALAALLSHPARIGYALAERVTFAAAGVDLESPLLEPGVIAAVLGSSLSLRDSAEWKPFLRKAGAGRLPASVLDQPKDNSMYAELRARALADRSAAELIDWMTRNAPFAGRVDPAILATMLPALASPPSSRQTLADAACNLLAIARWCRAIAARHHVT